jgi:hypothetical protein
MSKMEFSIEILQGKDVTDEVVAQCATLFSNHYAVWSTEAERLSGGKLVKSGRPSLHLMIEVDLLTWARSESQSVSKPHEKSVSW